MKRLSFLIILIFIGVSSLKAQSTDKIFQTLKSKNIKTHADLIKELEKQNLTEDQARQYAQLYGVDYDAFVRQYLPDTIGESGANIKLQATLGQVMLSPDTTAIVRSNSTNVPTVTIVSQNMVNKNDEIRPMWQDSIKQKNYFGYNLFQTIPSAFEPASVGPVDPGYLIGPGDVLRFYLWGEVEFQYELTVDQNGNIFIPTAGQIFVLGVPYEKLQTKLVNYLSKFYGGLATSPPSVFLDISLTKLRPIKIFAVGEVPKPGGYNISSFATVLNALYSIGGPTTFGSLREIRVMRGNNVVAKVDLYDFLLKGISSGDVRLQNNDMIFVPPRIKSVSVTGEVLREGIYELKAGEKLQDLINFSGGLKATAYVGRVQIKRILPFKDRIKYKPEMTIIDVELDKIISGEVLDIELFDNDEVTIFPIVRRIENIVEIEGAVYRPGAYDLGKVVNIGQLIKGAYGLLPEAYLVKADLIRTRPNKTLEFITINLKEAIAENPLYNVQLKPLDKIKIYSMYDIQENQIVSISGYVKKEVSILFADNLTLFDMISKAGGLQDTIFGGKAFTLRGDIIRLNSDGYTSRIVPFRLDNLLKDNSANNMNLRPGDKIYIYKGNVDKELERYVRIEGQVRNPGEYKLNSNMTPMDLILQAGGFTLQALRDFVYVNRIKREGYKGDKLSENLTVQLPKSFNFDRKDSSFVLQNFDVVVVRVNPDFEKQRIVNISGEVVYPGVYVLSKKNETIVDLLVEAGGPTSEAFLLGAKFTRGSRKVILNLEALYEDSDSEENIFLQSNDSVFIPKRPSSVIVSGEVNSPGIFKYIRGEDVNDYIDRAGGLTEDADYAVYTQPTGVSVRVNFGWFRGDPEVFDGSTIFVKKLPPPDPTANFDLTSLIKDVFAISASVLTIIVLVTRLN